MKHINVFSGSTSSENERRQEFYNLFKNCPIPDNEILSNLGLFINRQTLSRILFMNELYSKIVNIHGVVMEFGVRWGQNLSLFESFRGMYEPFNYNRKIIGFDTFEGFPSVSDQDGNKINVGDYSVTKDYDEYLEKIIKYQESENPIPHIKKSILIKGDATKTLPEYLNKHPETIVAFAYFDFDLYESTKVCLDAIKPHLTKGSVIGFDELNFEKFPGETIALREVFGLDRYKIQRSPFNPLMSYIVIE